MEPVSVIAAIRAAARQFGVSVADIRSQRRTRDVHPARIWGVYLAAETSGASLAAIGAAFGGRDEMIVRMYVRACAREVASDPRAAHLFEQLKSSLAAG